MRNCASEACATKSAAADLAFISAERTRASPSSGGASGNDDGYVGLIDRDGGTFSRATRQLTLAKIWAQESPSNMQRACFYFTCGDATVFISLANSRDTTRRFDCDDKLRWDHAVFERDASNQERDDVRG